MTAIKICKDCKYFGYKSKWYHSSWRKTFNTTYAKCQHPEAIYYSSESLVDDGDHIRYYCSNMRGYKCGKEAKLFEPVEE